MQTKRLKCSMAWKRMRDACGAETINTLTLAKILMLTQTSMSCPALPDSDNYEHCQNNMAWGYL